MKIKLYIIGLLTSAVLFNSGCKSNGKSAETTKEPEEHHEEAENMVELTSIQYETAGIEVGNIEEKQISGVIKANGFLDSPPQNLVSVSVPMGGFLKKTDLLQGSRVKKGQVIAVIENPDFIQMQQDYLETQSQLEFAKAEYERQQLLAKENVTAQKTVQQVKSNYFTLQAKSNGLKAKLKLININPDRIVNGANGITSTINIYSPINGYVTEMNANMGKFVNPTDVIFEIVDTEHLHAELTIFEKDVPELKIGQNVRFTLANETKERIAKVHLIGREISADRTVRIHCHLDKEDTQLLPGMYLKAVVETGSERVPALPEEAIVNFEGKNYVFAFKGKEEIKENEKAPKQESHAQESGNYVFEMVEVQKGVSESGFTGVTLPQNLPAETKIAVKGVYSLLAKLKNSEEEGHGH